MQGDGSFAEVNDKDRPYEGGAEGAMNLPELSAFAEASGMKKKESDIPQTPLEPLPELPEMPMTVDQAYDFLGVKKEDRGNLDKARASERASAERPPPLKPPPSRLKLAAASRARPPPTPLLPRCPRPFR